MLITSFEEAAQIQGIDVAQFEKGFDFIPEPHREAIKSVSKLVLIVEECNKDEDGKIWISDYTDGSWKYTLVFNMASPSGVGFSYDDCVCWSSCSAVGSRLEFRDRKTEKHVVEHFPQLYKAWMVLNNSKI